jgi:dihydroorotate dehydrogenase electron transfer subunit
MDRHSCSIVAQEALTPDIFRLTLSSVRIAESARPGQFVHLRVTDGIDPLLRRPFSIHGVNRDRGTFDLLYRCVGKGTGLLCRRHSGAFDVLGPLGNGFTFSDQSDAVVVAGGMGAAPVFFLLDELLDSGVRPIFFWGVKQSREAFCLRNLRERGVDLRLASEDGLTGEPGLVTRLLAEWIDANPDAFRNPGYVCGPKAMLAAVDSAAKSTLNWQVSVEERMACGAGACMGCAVRMRSGGYRTACSDGPIFRLGEVDWNG